jgi:hypothetical protein
VLLRLVDDEHSEGIVLEAADAELRITARNAASTELSSASGNP